LVKNADQLLVRPIELYEFPYPNILRLDSQTNFDDKSISTRVKGFIFYKSNQSIKGKEFKFNFKPISFQNK
jgi:hypothetical protein